MALCSTIYLPRDWFKMKHFGSMLIRSSTSLSVSLSLSPVYLHLYVIYSCSSFFVVFNVYGLHRHQTEITIARGGERRRKPVRWLFARSSLKISKWFFFAPELNFVCVRALFSRCSFVLIAVVKELHNQKWFAFVDCQREMEKRREREQWKKSISSVELSVKLTFSLHLIKFNQVT